MDEILGTHRAGAALRSFRLAAGQPGGAQSAGQRGWHGCDLGHDPIMSETTSRPGRGL
jgi:hypothetical protein